MKTKHRVYGGIEAGGTKFACAVGTGLDDIWSETRLTTTTPEETIGRAIDFFRKTREKEKIEAIGIGSFGPLDLNPDSPTYGYITSTPKSGWQNTDFAGRVRDALNVPVIIDTDVNAAALGEGKWGAAQGLDTFIYLTVGTGIGGGGVINGRLMRGLVHPEMGHIRLPHDRERDPFEGSCPYHRDCWEGMASGEAIAQRWGTKAEDLSDDHPAWMLEAEYLAVGIANLIVTISSQRVITGGGIMKKNGLIEDVRLRVVSILNGYVIAPEITEKIDEYIVLPGLGDRAGVLGAMAMVMG
jgi:fructokinase